MARDATLLTTRDTTAKHPTTARLVPPDIAPGQFGYGRALMPIQLFVDGYDRSFAMPMIAPLLSQPIVELGLQGESWDWCAGGHDRALARAAFADRLARWCEIDGQRAVSSLCSLRPITGRRGAIREFLLDGYLASAGIIDRDAVDAALKPPADRARRRLYPPFADRRRRALDPFPLSPRGDQARKERTGRDGA